MEGLLADAHLARLKRWPLFQKGLQSLNEFFRLGTHYSQVFQYGLAVPRRLALPGAALAEVAGSTSPCRPRRVLCAARAEAVGEDDVSAALCPGADFGGDVRGAVHELLCEAQAQLEPSLRSPVFDAGSKSERLLTDLGSASCRVCPRKGVHFLDEIDAVRGQSLISGLRQLRAGFPKRPNEAPWSLMLCGLRDVREDKTASPFNVKVKSLTFSTLTDDEVRGLLLQHTVETGQPIEEAALRRLTEYAGGQPWLVTALARDLVEEMRVEGPITEEHVATAKERLVLARATHLDSLVSKLTEERVRRVIQPLLSGETVAVDDVFDDDVSYFIDLGLVKNNPLRMANPIYTEVVARAVAGVDGVSAAGGEWRGHRHEGILNWPPSHPPSRQLAVDRRPGQETTARGARSEGVAGGQERSPRRGPRTERCLPVGPWPRRRHSGAV